MWSGCNNSRFTSWAKSIMITNFNLRSVRCTKKSKNLEFVTTNCYNQNNASHFECCFMRETSAPTKKNQWVCRIWASASHPGNPTSFLENLLFFKKIATPTTTTNNRKTKDTWRRKNQPLTPFCRVVLLFRDDASCDWRVHRAIANYPTEPATNINTKKGNNWKTLLKKLLKTYLDRHTVLFDINITSDRIYRKISNNLFIIVNY